MSGKSRDCHVWQIQGLPCLASPGTAMSGKSRDCHVWQIQELPCLASPGTAMSLCQAVLVLPCHASLGIPCLPSCKPRSCTSSLGPLFRFVPKPFETAALELRCTHLVSILVPHGPSTIFLHLLSPYLADPGTLLPTSGLRRPVAAAQYCVSQQIPGQQL